MQQLLRKTSGDKVIWSVVILLSLTSLLAVYSSTQSLAFRMDKNASYYLIKQLVFLSLGLLIIYVVHRINYTRFAKLSLVLYLVSIPLLIYTLVSGTSLNDGSRWLTLPVINLTFQTSDMAKLVLFIYLARILSQKQAVIKDLKKGFLKVVTPVVITCALIAPANLSTALMLGFTCSILFFIGRVKVMHILSIAGIGFVLLLLFIPISKMTGFGRGATWENRIKNFISKDENTKEADEKGKDFQVLQAKIAIASGGLSGKGPGRSEAKDYLPHGYSDFIYANIIAEYGLLGGFFLLVFYLLFLWRSILIFKKCPFGFGSFLAIGISVTLVFQALLNMAVNVHLVPVTGLTLPLVSMGGSSIWFTSISIGIVLSVSRYVEEEVITNKAKFKNNINNHQLDISN